MLLILVLILPALTLIPQVWAIHSSANISVRREYWKARSLLALADSGIRSALGNLLCLEERGSDHCDRAQHPLLPPVLQMDLPAGRFLLAL